MKKILLILPLAALLCGCSGQMPHPALKGLTLSENVLYFTDDALTGKLTVLCSYRWTVSAPDFVTLSQTEGVGVDYILITIAPEALVEYFPGEQLEQLTFRSSQGETQTLRLVYSLPAPPKIVKIADVVNPIIEDMIIDGSESQPFVGSLIIEGENANVMLRNINIESTEQAIVVKSNAKLVLDGTNKVISDNGAGIFIAANKTLTIFSTSPSNTLEATGKKGCGIGGNEEDNNNTGNIIVDGGTITAKAQSVQWASAGIGSSAANTGGTITFHNATVYAYGCKATRVLAAGAGVGCGSSTSYGRIGDIVIENTVLYTQKGFNNYGFDNPSHIGGYNHGTITIKNSTIHKSSAESGTNLSQHGIDEYDENGVKTVLKPSEI
jgi:hypothetical protein